MHVSSCAGNKAPTAKESSHQTEYVNMQSVTEAAELSLASTPTHNQEYESLTGSEQTTAEVYYIHKQP